MPIHKRRRQIGNEIDVVASQYEKYSDFREEWWKLQDNEGVDFAGNRRNGLELDDHDMLLDPKRVVLFHDIWHCGSSTSAKLVVRNIATFPDISELKYNGSWVWVKYIDNTKDHILPGQEGNDRKRVTG